MFQSLIHQGKNASSGGSPLPESTIVGMFQSLIHQGKNASANAEVRWESNDGAMGFNPLFIRGKMQEYLCTIIVVSKVEISFNPLFIRGKMQDSRRFILGCTDW